MATPSASAPRILRLVGVYDADHTLGGEVAYLVGKWLGRAHCGLCDITHGTFREREEWTQCRAGLPVPFDTFHRDDQPDVVRAAAGGAAPVVVAETDRGVTGMLGAAQLDACQGSIEALVTAVEDAVAAAGLTWPVEG